MGFASYWHVAHHSESPDERLKMFETFFSDDTVLVACDSWCEIALLGVADVWSVVRKLAAKKMSDGLRRTKKSIVSLLPAIIEFVHPSQQWYKKEGVLLLLKHYLHEAQDIEWNTVAAPHMLLMSVALPLAVHEQRELRSIAVGLINPLCEAGGETEYFPLVANWIRCNLADSRIANIEGAASTLQCTPSIRRELVQTCSSVLGKLKSHPAATIRQVVADVLSSASPASELLLGVLDSQRESWEAVETSFMALHGCLLGILGKEENLQTHFPGPVEVAWLFEVTTQVALKLKDHQFEVHRMAKQLLPLLVQLSVRTGTWEQVASLCSNFADCSLLASNACWFSVLRGFLEPPSKSWDLHFFYDKGVVPRLIARTYDLTGEPCTEDDWRTALKEDEEVAKYAPDCAAVQPAPWMFVGAWVEAALHAREPHVQCLLIEAVRIALLPIASHTLFHFCSHQDFAPPVLEGDGGNATSGRVWIERRGKPTVQLQRRKRDDSLRLESIASSPCVAQVSHLLKGLLPKKATEPVVVHRLITLSLAMTDEGLLLPDHVFELVTERLTIVSPNWRTGSFQVDQKTSDWDDSGSDSDSLVETISIETEFLTAQRVVSVIGSAIHAKYDPDIQLIMKYDTPLAHSKK